LALAAGRLARSSSTTQLTGSAKFRFWPSAMKNAVMPTSRPSMSNKPPPLDPWEIAAEVWMYCEPSKSRRLEMMPSLKVSSSPSGAPMA
jgi:hypothetical protein